MDKSQKWLKPLQKENDKIRDKIKDIFEDLQLEESADELWELIGALIENEIQQEELCNE